jgi:hypothetical protein
MPLGVVLVCDMDVVHLAGVWEVRGFHLDGVDHVRGRVSRVGCT